MSVEDEAEQMAERIYGWLPVPVLIVNSVPGSSEGAALFVAVVVEREARKIACLIVHEKVHIVQQWALTGLVMGALLAAGLPWWGLAAAPVLYGLGWLVRPVRSWLEEQADHIQRACQGSEGKPEGLCRARVEVESYVRRGWVGSPEELVEMAEELVAELGSDVTCGGGGS